MYLKTVKLGFMLVPATEEKNTEKGKGHRPPSPAIVGKMVKSAGTAGCDRFKIK
jgi:hypothetical protein